MYQTLFELTKTLELKAETEYSRSLPRGHHLILVTRWCREQSIIWMQLVEGRVRRLHGSTCHNIMELRQATARSWQLIGFHSTHVTWRCDLCFNTGTKSLFRGIFVLSAIRKLLFIKVILLSLRKSINVRT